MRTLTLASPVYRPNSSALTLIWVKMGKHGKLCQSGRRPCLIVTRTDISIFLSTCLLISAPFVLCSPDPQNPPCPDMHSWHCTFPCPVCCDCACCVLGVLAGLCSVLARATFTLPQGRAGAVDVQLSQHSFPSQSELR